MYEDTCLICFVGQQPTLLTILVATQGVAHCVAGEAVELAVRAVDGQGNPTVWPADSLVTLATLGPTPVPLAETRREGDTALFRHTFTKAGGYSLQVRVGAVPPGVVAMHTRADITRDPRAGRWGGTAGRGTVPTGGEAAATVAVFSPGTA